MACRLISTKHINLQNPNSNFLHFFTCNFSTSFLSTNTPKSMKKKRKKKNKESPRTKAFLSKQRERVLRLDDAGKLHHELGFPRGRKVVRSIERHTLLFQTYRHEDRKMWFGFTDFMEELLEEERVIMDEMECDRVNTVRKLIMMSAKKRIPLSKIYQCRLLFGIPEDCRDRVVKYPDYFKLVVEDDGRRVLELVKWDPLLAVSALEVDFMVDENRVKKAFKFPVKNGNDLDLDEDDTRKLNFAEHASVGIALLRWIKI